MLLDLEGEQDLLDLTLIGLLGTQEKIPRHLHGDRTRPLAVGTAAKVGPQCACNPQKIDAVVVIKIIILGCKNRLNQQIRNVVGVQQYAFLFAELGEQFALGRIYAHGYFELLFGKRQDRGQPRREQRHDHGEYERPGDDETEECDQQRSP